MSPFSAPFFWGLHFREHPNYDVSLGEQLIHDTYYALRNGPGWDDTLFIITYDEHGGNYDHVPPPWSAVNPDNSVGEWNFDFTRFGVRIPALLISPRIAAGTVFRAKQGTIDHTSVLKTIEKRWKIPSLTARDKAAPDLGDALTLSTPRKDDPLAGVSIPVSRPAHPNQSQPSVIELLHAKKVADLPLRNDQGIYDEHTPPDFSSSAQIGDYIQARTAAWTQHLQRMRQRRGQFQRSAPCVYQRNQPSHKTEKLVRNETRKAEGIALSPGAILTSSRQRQNAFGKMAEEERKIQNVIPVCPRRSQRPGHRFLKLFATWQEPFVSTLY